MGLCLTMLASGCGQRKSTHDVFLPGALTTICHYPRNFFCSCRMRQWAANAFRSPVSLHLPQPFLLFLLSALQAEIECSEVRIGHIHIAQLIASQRKQSVDLQHEISIGIFRYSEKATHRRLHGCYHHDNRYRPKCLFLKAIRRRRHALWRCFYSLTIQCCLCG